MEMGQLFLGCAYNSGEIVFCSAVRGEKEEKKNTKLFHHQSWFISKSVLWNIVADIWCVFHIRVDIQKPSWKRFTNRLTGDIYVDRNEPAQQG